MDSNEGAACKFPNLWGYLKYGNSFNPEDLASLPRTHQSISYAAWPEFNEAYLEDDSFAYPVSFNGKIKFKLELPIGLTIPEIESEVMQHADTLKFLEGKTPKKTIIVPKKIVNLVV